MESFLTLIAAKPDALRLPKINGDNDLVTCMGYGLYNQVDDLPENTPLYSMFSFNENSVKKTANRLNFAQFSGEHCLSFNLFPIRFYSKDGESAGKEARQFLNDIGLNRTDYTHALFHEIKDDYGNETFLFIHAATCGALLSPSRSLCDELYNFGLSLKQAYQSIDIEMYSLRTMIKARSVVDCRRGDWPLRGMFGDKHPDCEPLKTWFLDSVRKMAGK